MAAHLNEAAVPPSLMRELAHGARVVCTFLAHKLGLRKRAYDAALDRTFAVMTDEEWEAELCPEARDMAQHQVSVCADVIYGLASPLPLTWLSGAVCDAALARRKQQRNPFSVHWPSTLHRHRVLDAFASSCSAISPWQGDHAEQSRVLANTVQSVRVLPSQQLGQNGAVDEVLVDTYVRNSIDAGTPLSRTESAVFQMPDRVKQRSQPALPDSPNVLARKPQSTAEKNKQAMRASQRRRMAACMPKTLVNSDESTPIEPVDERTPSEREAAEERERWSKLTWRQRCGAVLRSLPHSDPAGRLLRAIDRTLAPRRKRQ